MFCDNQHMSFQLVFDPIPFTDTGSRVLSWGKHFGEVFKQDVCVSARLEGF
jgi:hypothetical protein